MTQYTILGAGGFIGGYLKQALPNAYAPARGDEGIFKKSLGRVFYCIGLTNDYKDRPFDTVEAHVSFLSRVLKSASFERLVYLSSTRLYDSLAGERVMESADLVLNSANPRHLYDLSKALGENLCLTASGGRACVARLSSVYDVVPAATGFLPDILRRLKKERQFTLDSATGIVRDYVHVNDVAQGLIRMLDGKETGIINIASGENVSNADIVDTLNRAGCAITLQRQTPRENHPVIDIEKLRTLGIKPVSTLTFLQSFMQEQVKHATR